MALTSEQLQRAGANPELAKLLARDSRQSNITQNPMFVGLTVTFVAAFLGALGWIVLGLKDTQTDVALLNQGQARLEEGQAHIDKKLDDLAAELANIKDLLIDRN